MIATKHTVKIVILLAVLVGTALTAKQTKKQTTQENDNEQQDRLVSDFVDALQPNAKSPTDYVVDKFEHHDIILLGEVHQVKENCDLVASLIAPLNANGVKRLCSEFTPSRFNDQLKRIVTDKKFDESAVMDLFRNGPWPNWGHREYMDIIKSAWAVNQNLAEDELPFLIIGIDSDWSQVKQFEMDRKQRFEMAVEREQNMTRTIVETAIEQDQKTLVHIGFAHTVPHGIRVGNELKKSYEDRLFQIMLHHALRTRSGLSEITTIIERAFAEGDLPPAGFDVKETPISEMDDPSIPYVKEFNELAAGYIFLKPASELSRTTWVDGFINESNFEDALMLAKRFGWTKDKMPETPEELDELCAKMFGSR